MKKSPQHAIGIFVEGATIHVVALTKKNGAIQLIDAENFKLADRLESAPVGETHLQKTSEPFGNLPDPVYTPTEENKSYISPPVKDNSINNVAVLKEILNKYSHKKYKIAISLAEPQIHYFYFNAELDLKESESKKRIIAELKQIRPDAEFLTPDSLFLIKLADNRVMAIVRNNEINIINLLKRVQPNTLKRISFVESAEISLINLINTSYDFSELELSVVVYIGLETSRIIFLQGKRILNISYIIGVGMEAENIANTIYSRILLEQDNLNLSKIYNIILTGECYKTGIQEFLEARMPSEINIQYVSFEGLKLYGLDPLMSRFSIACGAATRVLENRDESLYKVDLIPRDIKETRQFRLGIGGWLLLFLCPILSFISTIKYGQQNRELTQLEIQVNSRQAEVDLLLDMEMRLNVHRRKQKNLAKALGILDSLSASSGAWSSFMVKISKAADGVKQLWISDIDQVSNGKVLLHGYSVKRNRILQFGKRLGEAKINKVEVQEIRNQKLYAFDIEMPFNKK